MSAPEPDHRAYFTRFAQLDSELGGPDHHLACLAQIGRELAPADQGWLAGCYIAFYNVPGAELFYHRWGPAELGDGAVTGWLRDNWAGIPYRRERKAIRSPDKTTRYFQSYARWAVEVLPGLSYATPYEDWWSAAGAIYGVGRYMQMKLIEVFHRWGRAPGQPDMRAPGGRNAAQGAALIWPSLGPTLLVDNEKGWALLNACGAFLGEQLGMTPFSTQVYLCEYKQAWRGRQYPGRSLDSDLRYHAQVMDSGLFPAYDGARMFAARAAVNPPQALGELRGWTGPRDLGHTLKEYGYLWSDLHYDYQATADLAFPQGW